jgi:hypothetical protein
MEMNVATVAVALGMAWMFWHVRRLNDPLDYASLDVGYQPRFSTARFDGLRKYDPITYDAGFAALSEFSRVYQSSFVEEVRPEVVVKHLASCRNVARKEFHALRRWLPNDLPLNRRLLAGIEETDAAMAVAMADIADRFPDVRLQYGAGIISHPTLKGKDDWFP